MGVRYAACADESRPAIRIAKAGSRFCNATLRLAPPAGGPGALAQDFAPPACWKVPRACPWAPQKKSRASNTTPGSGV